MFKNVCIVCGNAFEAYSKNQKFCSANCAKKYHKGEVAKSKKLPKTELEKKKKEEKEIRANERQGMTYAEWQKKKTWEWLAQTGVCDENGHWL